MNQWEDIYAAAERILKDILKHLEKEEAEIQETENVKNNFSEHYLTKRLRFQAKYDASVAFRKLQAHRRIRWVRRYSVAASIFLAAVVAVTLFYHKHPETMSPETILSEQQIQPGQRKAILTLANGSVMDLRDSSLAVNDLKKCLSEDSIKSGINGLEVSGEDIPYHTLSVPRGGEFFLTLPDNTRVWLNSETELHFPAQFSANFRSVILKGEAYFEVAHEKNRPFLVHSGETMITVYGTQFCVTAYEQSDFVATLVEGSIGFRSPEGKKVRLKPSQQLTYSRGTGELTVRKVDTRVYTSWKDQLFCFEEQSLEKILNVLARWYDVEVTFESEDLKQMKFSGTIDKYSEIGPFLKLFEAGANVRFDIFQKNIIVRRKP